MLPRKYLTSNTGYSRFKGFKSFQNLSNKMRKIVLLIMIEQQVNNLDFRPAWFRGFFTSLENDFWSDLLLMLGLPVCTRNLFNSYQSNRSQHQSKLIKPISEFKLALSQYVAVFQHFFSFTDLNCSNYSNFFASYY